MTSAMPPSDPSPSREVMEAAAAAWLSLRDRGMDATETAEFVRWLQQDPQHAEVFEELDRAWKDLDRLAAVPGPVGGEPDGDLLVPRTRRRHRAAMWSALAAAAAVALGVFITVQVGKPSYTAETSVGAFEKVDLPDGSVAQLNTDSAIDVTFDAAERRVRVVRGEVFFSVTKDPARPFIVTAETVSVWAVGTAFNVRQREAAVEVLVTEGSVRVHDTSERKAQLSSSSRVAELPLIVAGERALVSLAARPSTAAMPQPTVTKISATEAHRALAWQERRLEFEDVSLDEVIQEFNRYNRRQLVIADASLAEKRFSGTFRADGYEALVRLLETNFGVTAASETSGIVLRRRR